MACSGASIKTAAARKSLVQRIEEMRLDRETENGIARLMERCMSEDYEGRSFFQNRFHCRLVIREGVKIIGHLALDFRAIRLGENLVDCVGIGDVAVHPDYRRRGLGTALVDAALAEGHQSPASFALLFGRQSIYSTAGFVSAPNELTFTPTRGARTSQTVVQRHGFFMVCPLREEIWDNTLPVDLAGYPF